MNFDRQIKLYSRAVTQNDAGEQIISYELLVTTMAEKVFKRSIEQTEANQKVGKTTESFRIRWRNLSFVNVLEYDGIKYDITGIQEEGRKHLIVLECEKKDNE